MPETPNTITQDGTPPKALHTCPFCTQNTIQTVQQDANVVPHCNPTIVIFYKWWTYHCTNCNEQFRSRECEQLSYNHYLDYELRKTSKERAKQWAKS